MATKYHLARIDSPIVTLASDTGKEIEIDLSKFLLRFECSECGGGIRYGCKTESGKDGVYFAFCSQCNADTFISSRIAVIEEAEADIAWEGLPESFKQAVLSREE